jgi:hypothetical protein
MVRQGIDDVNRHGISSRWGLPVERIRRLLEEGGVYNQSEE